MDRIGPHEALLPINQNYNKIWVTNWTLVIHFHNIIKCKTTTHANEALCPLTRAWHVNCPFNCAITPSNNKHDRWLGDCPISAQIRLVITNQVWEYYFVIVLINNGNRTQWSSIWSVIIRVINKIRWPRSGSPICQSRLWLPAELDETKFCYQLIITIIIKKKKHLGQTSPSGIMSTVKNLQPTVQFHYPITTVQSD